MILVEYQLAVATVVAAVVAVEVAFVSFVGAPVGLHDLLVLVVSWVVSSSEEACLAFLPL